MQQLTHNFLHITTFLLSIVHRLSEIVCCFSFILVYFTRYTIPPLSMLLPIAGLYSLKNNLFIFQFPYVFLIYYLRMLYSLYLLYSFLLTNTFHSLNLHPYPKPIFFNVCEGFACMHMNRVHVTPVEVKRGSQILCNCSYRWL